MVKRTAHIVSVKAGAPNGFRWRWTSDDGTKSTTSFEYYYECVADARDAGYDVPLRGAGARNVDGSDRQKL